MQINAHTVDSKVAMSWRIAFKSNSVLNVALLSLLVLGVGINIYIDVPGCRVWG